MFNWRILELLWKWIKNNYFQLHVFLSFQHKLVQSCFECLGYFSNIQLESFEMFIDTARLCIFRLKIDLFSACLIWGSHSSCGKLENTLKSLLKAVKRHAYPPWRGYEKQAPATIRWNSRKNYFLIVNFQ